MRWLIPSLDDVQREYPEFVQRLVQRLGGRESRARALWLAVFRIFAEANRGATRDALFHAVVLFIDMTIRLWQGPVSQDAMDRFLAHLRQEVESRV